MMVRGGLLLGLLLLLSSCFGGGGGVTPVRTAFTRGVYHYSRGNHDAAISEYREAIEDDEEDHRARFNLAVALEARADQYQDAGDAARASRDQEEAEALYLAILAHRPGDLRASINLAAREIHKGDPVGGYTRLGKAAKDHRHSALPLVALAAHRLREFGDAPVPERRVALEEAHASLETALDRDPGNLSGNMLFGDVCVALAEIAPEKDDAEELRDDARDAYGAALARDPDDIATLLGLARLDQAEGDPVAARSRLEQVVAIDPRHVGAHVRLAELHEATGALEAATRHIWTARRLDRGTPPVLAAGEYRRRLLRLYAALVEDER